MADATNFSLITSFIGEFLATEDTGSDQLIPDFTEKNRLLVFQLFIYIYFTETHIQMFSPFFARILPALDAEPLRKAGTALASVVSEKTRTLLSEASFPPLPVSRDFWTQTAERPEGIVRLRSPF